MQKTGEPLRNENDPQATWFGPHLEKEGVLVSQPGKQLSQY